VLFAFSLRSAVASLSPLIEHITVDFAMPAAVIGLIGTAPPFCYAVFGILTPLFERRLGLERLTVIAIVVVTIGTVLRSFADDSVALLLGTALIFAAVGVGNILLPPLCARTSPIASADDDDLLHDDGGRDPDPASRRGAGGGRVELETLARPVGGVRGRRADPVDRDARARTRRAADDLEAPNPRVFGRMWRLPLAWALAVGFLAAGTVAYVSFAWLPQLLVDIAGVTPATAGALLALFAAMGLPASLLVPSW